MHLPAATRLDIGSAVINVSRFIQKQQVEHWMVTKRMLRSLQTTKSHGICFKPSKSWTFATTRMQTRPATMQTASQFFDMLYSNGCFSKVKK